MLGHGNTFITLNFQGFKVFRIIAYAIRKQGLETTVSTILNKYFNEKF